MDMTVTFRDRDQDKSPRNCVLQYGKGGWWHKGCGFACLTGQHTETKTQIGRNQISYWQGGKRGNTWDSWKEAEMLLVPFWNIRAKIWEQIVKVPSEMKWAACYNCWHCWHCWLCWHCWQCGCQGVFSNWMSHAEFQENFLIDCRTRVSSQGVFSNWLSHVGVQEYFLIHCCTRLSRSIF